MSPTSRRTFLYWVLLLLPTLAVGLVAIQLLRRERERIAQQSASARESRQAALEARARLIVENLELLVGDVQQGLVDALAEQPPEALDALIADWEANNPLVKTVFVARRDGELLRPRLDSSDDRARGFARRFGAAWRQQPPWRPAAEDEAGETKTADLAKTEARGEVTSNVAQVQSARRDVQQLLKARNYALGSSGPAEADAVAEARRDERARAQRAQTESTREAAARKLAATAPLRSGWVARTIDGRLHLLGWVETTSEVRGVEIDLGELVSRLKDALPAEPAADEGFVLRDERGRGLQQVGTVGREASAALRVPVANAMLSGWEVAAYLPLRVYTGASGGAFFWIGALMVAIFVAAILAGGLLLLGQARRSEQEAAQKTSFVANVSHEFKTPLTTIRLYAELLEQGRVRGPEQSGEYLRTIGRETQRLTRLVNNALDFSRLEQGKKKFAAESIDLAAHLARLLDVQAPRLAELKLILVRALPEAPLPVVGDRDAIEQIVLNLIDNAGKYAVEGGEVMVSATQRAGGGAEVRVSDRGPGVPAEHRERIFEKFHRADEALTAEKGGAGLGLSIARQLARGMGGELRYADRPGGGAEFILELP